jgi:hypothetical protein
MPALRELVATSENVILESNSVLGFLRPSLYLAVLNYAVADFKDSAQRFLDRADAFVVVDAGAHGPRWGNIPWRRIESKPRFAVQPPDYFSEQLRAFLLPYVAAVVSAKPA